MMYVVTAVRRGDSAASVVQETMSEDSATRLLAALRRYPKVGGVESGTVALHALAPGCRCMQPYTCGDMRGRIEALVSGSTCDPHCNCPDCMQAHIDQELPYDAP